MLLIMFDVLVPIGICVILFLRSSTPYSQAVERKGTGVAFAPKPVGVAFAPKPSGSKLF